MADLKMLTTDENGTLRVGLVRPPVKIRGMDVLVQIVGLELLRNPGRNVLNPSAGAGFRQLIGTNIEDEAEFFADLRLRVSQAETNIKASQEGTTRSQDERLARLNLVDMIPLNQGDGVELIIEIVSESEEVRQANFGVR